jgi:NAD(P)-dependent dehydrogenase (short-subunit alcohol dehydrogenase family)
LEIPDDLWLSGFDILVMNVVRMVRLVTPIMQKQGGGTWVNISIFAAFEPELTLPASCTLRAPLSAFS